MKEVQNITELTNNKHKKSPRFTAKIISKSNTGFKAVFEEACRTEKEKNDDNRF